MSLKNRILMSLGFATLILAVTVVDVKPVHGAVTAPVPANGGSAVHGVNFMMKTIVDETFCLETDGAVSTTPRVYIAPCTGRGNQRWTFTDGVDGSSVVVGDLGQCLMVEHGPKPERLAIAVCDYHTDQRFTVSPSGLIQEKHSDECLTVNSPIVSGEEIFVEECGVQLVREQTWRLAM